MLLKLQIEYFHILFTLLYPVFLRHLLRYKNSRVRVRIPSDMKFLYDVRMKIQSTLNAVSKLQENKNILNSQAYNSKFLWPHTRKRHVKNVFLIRVKLKYLYKCVDLIEVYKAYPLNVIGSFYFDVTVNRRSNEFVSILIIMWCEWAREWAFIGCRNSLWFWVLWEINSYS